MPRAWQPFTWHPTASCTATSPSTAPPPRPPAPAPPPTPCTPPSTPRALLLPLDPYGHGLLHALPPDACRTRGHGKRKSWNFIHEKMSYDTFFTMKRLIERSRSVGEVLRWVTQNPGKVSASHYPIALHKLGQLLQQQQGPAALNGESRRPGPVLEQPEFQTLCQAIISGCSKFDNFSIVNCLYAAAALGEWPRASCGSGEFRALGRVPQPPGPLQPEGRLHGVQQRHAAAPLQPSPPGRVVPQQLGAAPGEGNLTPYTMALIAKYVARHRLREPRLLDTIANFLLKRGEQLDSKVIQKLVFPFSRMNYRPSNHSELFPKLEAILEQKAGSSPLATVNILMSMFQLSHFPQSVLHQVFSPAFITNVMSTPYALIVRRYLSLLDAAVELEFRDYSGPRLDPRYRVLMFEHALTADEANRKYRLGAELLGRSSAKKDLGVVVANSQPAVCHRLTTGRQCVLVAKEANGMHCRERGQQGEGGDPPLCSALGGTSGAVHPVLGCPVPGRRELLEKAQWGMRGGGAWSTS
uniref:Fas activated serine/threonine kinase n=1 Tax=Meleagris gallopavo TaxID=9103 RepID=A0A803YPK7_MELGA